MKKWKINSWRNYPVKHIPKYDDEKDLNLVLDKIKSFPPLVFAGETTHLKNQLADVVDGKAFLLQGGDCAESFAEFNPDKIRDYFKVFLQILNQGILKENTPQINLVSQFTSQLILIYLMVQYIFGVLYLVIKSVFLMV